MKKARLRFLKPLLIIDFIIWVYCRMEKLTQIQIDQILKDAKNRIKDESFVSMRWLMIDKLKVTDSINDVDMVSCKLTRHRRYIKYEGHDPNGYFVTTNPFYKNELLFQSKVAAIARGVSIIVGIIVYQYQSRQESQKYNILNVEYRMMQKTIDSLISLPIYQKR